MQSRRQKVKQLSAERKAKLLDSLAWQKFCRDVDEVSSVTRQPCDLYNHVVFTRCIK